MSDINNFDDSNDFDDSNNFNEIDSSSDTDEIDEWYVDDEDDEDDDEDEDEDEDEDDEEVLELDDGTKIRFVDMPKIPRTLPFYVPQAYTMLRELCVLQLIDAAVPEDECFGRVFPSEIAATIILSIIHEERLELTRLIQSYPLFDYRYLFGRELDEEDFNEEVLALLMERLGQADVGAIYEEIALGGLQHYGIDVKHLQASATSLPFADPEHYLRANLFPFWAFWEDEEDYYSDDSPHGAYRIDQISTESGLVIAFEPCFDPEVERDRSERLARHLRRFQDELEAPEPLWLGGSKALEVGQLEALLAQKIQFIGRLPARFGKSLARNTIRRACDTPDAWVHLGKAGSGKWERDYQGQPFRVEVDGQELRLLVLHSRERALTAANCVCLVAQVPETMSDRDILLAHKELPKNEVNFLMIKKAMPTAALFLENTNRVRGLALLLHITALIRALSQYRIRRGYQAWRQKHPGEDLELAYSKNHQVTYQQFLDHSRGVSFRRMKDDLFSLSYSDREGYDKALKCMEFLGVERNQLLPVIYE